MNNYRYHLHDIYNNILLTINKKDKYNKYPPRLYGIWDKNIFECLLEYAKNNKSLKINENVIINKDILKFLNQKYKNV